MKISKFLAGSLFLATLMVGFASCKDKEPDDPFNNGGNNNTPGQTDDTTAKGNGTEADPYNVQALLDMKTDGTLPEKGAGTEKAWVEGYIVGSYNFDNDPKFVLGTDPASKDNVLIADDANSTDTYAVSALKLGNYSTVVSLLNVPANLKKKIKVYGVVEKYCGVSGVVNLEKVYIDGTVVELPGATDVEVNDNMTPSEANAAATQLQAGAVSSNMAGVTGYVSKIATAYSSQHDNITIYMSNNQDTQETFYVYRMKGGSALKVGDKIKVTGNLTNYKGTSPQMNQGATYVLIEAVGGGEGGSGEGEGSGSEGGEVSGNTITLNTTPADMEWTSTSDATYGAGFTATASGVTVAFYQNKSNTAPRDPETNVGDNHIRVYATSILSIAAPEGKNIKKITITTTGGKCADLSVVGGGTATADTATAKITWTGSTSKFVAEATAQVRIASIELICE